MLRDLGSLKAEPSTAVSAVKEHRVRIKDGEKHGEEREAAQHHENLVRAHESITPFQASTHQFLYNTTWKQHYIEASSNM